MKILALDTSTEYCSVALWQDGVVSGRCELVGQKHSELLIAMIDALMQDADRKGLPRTTKGQSPKLLREGCRMQDMDGIAYGSGPGSFTGVRIACGAVQGLALGANLPVFGVCTLLAVAEGSGKSRVIAALDARMGEIYCAAYEKRDGDWITVFEPCLCKPENAPEVQGDNWFGAGSGFAAFSEALQLHYAGQLTGTDGAVIPQALHVAALAAAQTAGWMDAALAQPFYLRDKVALKTAEREALAAEKELNSKPQAGNS